jgi:FMN phosphatase YigB (HAD superfamily)
MPNMEQPTVFWDFDGTLARRRGGWTGCLREALNEVSPGHTITSERLRPGLSSGFPWHDWQRPHRELDTSQRWWEALRPTLVAAYRRVGIPAATAQTAADLVPGRYSDPARWQVFADVAPALDHAATAGWRNVVVSNHVPELPELIDRLALGRSLAGVVTSARTGYEKPHPEMYRAALAAAGNPPIVWMVGDNRAADVDGARSAGLSALLVRAPGAPVVDAAAAVEWILDRAGRTWA